MSPCSCAFFLIIVGAVIAFKIYSNKQSGKHPLSGFKINGVDPGGETSGPAMSAPVVPVAPVSFDGIKTNDPGFDEQMFYGKVTEMFMGIQNAWMARNLEPARRYMHDQQFNIMNGQIQGYIQRHQINIL